MNLDLLSNQQEEEIKQHKGLDQNETLKRIFQDTQHSRVDKTLLTDFELI